MLHQTDSHPHSLQSIIFFAGPAAAEMPVGDVGCKADDVRDISHARNFLHIICPDYFARGSFSGWTSGLVATTSTTPCVRVVDVSEKSTVVVLSELMITHAQALSGTQSLRLQRHILPGQYSR